MVLGFGKKRDLEPKTGDHPVENNVVERKLGLGKVGTWVLSNVSEGTADSSCSIFASVSMLLGYR